MSSIGIEPQTHGLTIWLNTVEEKKVSNVKLQKFDVERRLHDFLS